MVLAQFKSNLTNQVLSKSKPSEKANFYFDEFQYGVKIEFGEDFDYELSLGKERLILSAGKKLIEIEEIRGIDFKSILDDITLSEMLNDIYNQSTENLNNISLTLAMKGDLIKSLEVANLNENASHLWISHYNDLVYITIIRCIQNNKIDIVNEIRPIFQQWAKLGDYLSYHKTSLLFFLLVFL